MVIDTGLFCEAAITLAKRFKKVRYCCPGWVSATPVPNDAEIGKGMEGIEVVGDFHPYIEETDLFCFFDIYFGPLQVWLESQGKAVWGSRMSERFEIDRIKCREAMASVGLPVPKYEVVTGMPDLRKYLQGHKGVFVKGIKYRGSFETMNAATYAFIKPRLDKLEYDLGPFAAKEKFMVEDGIPDCVETGTDAWIVDGNLPARHMAGFEIKDLCYIARMVERESIPEPIRRWEEKMMPLFVKDGYRGNYSTEVRITKDKVPYMIDATMRLGSPPGELEMHLFKNFAEIVWYGANGIMQEPEERGEFGAQAIISSAWADGNMQPISFPKEYRDNIKLRNAVMIDGKFYVLPQRAAAAEIGSIVAYGDTLEQAIGHVKEIAGEISGYQIKVPLHAFDEADDELELARKMGLDFFSQKSQNPKP